MKASTRQGTGRAAPPTVGSLFAELQRYGTEVLAETIWPTRCAACDRAGKIICDDCLARLPYIDLLYACQSCGAPYSRIQCTECNDISLANMGLSALPFQQARSALVFDDLARSIVTTYKDGGERRLAEVMASIMAAYVEPAWIKAKPLISFIPATRRARQTRGFDHCKLLAEAIAARIDRPLATLLLPPRHADQRKLGRSGRAANLRTTPMTATSQARNQSVLLIDDVCTTGATLCAASAALHDAQANQVFCLTFARV